MDLKYFLYIIIKDRFHHPLLNLYKPEIQLIDTNSKYQVGEYFNPGKLEEI